MRKAIEKAIYYIDTDFLNPIITFEYSNESELSNIINDFHNHIDILAIFGNKENICYYIFSYLSSMYEQLLLNKTTEIFLVNRKDVCICLKRKLDTETPRRIAIIKVDSVLAEYKPPSYSSYFYYPLAVIIGGISVLPIVKYYSEN